ncbi:D-amino-acid N-acetyltransferase [Fusarium solani]|nr:D-amino-acid N-acetyltransferase [Fusarium solani]
MASSAQYQINELTSADFDGWSAMFRAYIDFYQATMEEEQYKRTFDRILNKENDLQALVLRRTVGGKESIVGIAHFFSEQTPWSEKQILMLNDLFVDPSVRGQGQGRKLIEAVAEIAKNMDCLRLQWLTKHDNTRARGLYDTMAQTSFVQYRMSLD